MIMRHRVVAVTLDRLGKGFFGKLGFFQLEIGEPEVGKNIRFVRGVAADLPEQLQREPLPLPRLAIHRKPASIFDYEFEDFEMRP